MKVYIGPYVDWIGPYQLAEKLLFWKNKYKSDSVFEFGKWLSENKNKEPSALNKFCNWFHNKKKRKVKIHIHNYDVWNMDSTLAMIILPMLKELKKEKHGSAFIDLEDVPPGLRYTTTEEYDSQQCFDFYWEEPKTTPDIHTRYEWFLDELIWTFETYCNDASDWEFDEESRKRVENGLRLFGKYYTTLWD